jgi:hypothetical protein
LIPRNEERRSLGIKGNIHPYYPQFPILDGEYCIPNVYMSVFE